MSETSRKTQHRLNDAQMFETETDESINEPASVTPTCIIASRLTRGRFYVLRNIEVNFNLTLETAVDKQSQVVQEKKNLDLQLYVTLQ